MANGDRTDPVIPWYIDQIGFAPVLVILKDQPASSPQSAQVVAASVAETSRVVTDCFLAEFPHDVRRTAASIRQAVAEYPGADPVVAAAAVRDVARRSRPEIAPKQYYPLLGVEWGHVDRVGLNRLLAHDAVEQVHHAVTLNSIPPVEVSPARPTGEKTWNLKKLEINQLWKEGLTGKGIRVAHLDTGVDATHPALRDRVVSFMEFGLDGHSIMKSKDKPRDSERHGTHTAGILCGGKIGRTAIGVAPGVELCSGMVVVGGKGTARVLAGIEWALGQHVKIITMSIGFAGFVPAFTRIISRIRAQGVLLVAAIGNDGPGTSLSPANLPGCLSVGATDRRDQVADFSSSIAFNRPFDPFAPDVVAPGVRILSAKAGGGALYMTGTSFATPHVAGLAALLMEAEPNADIAVIEKSIEQSARRLLDFSPQRYGNGLIDPYVAWERVML
jgi:subtilisin family serine protease